MFGKSKSRLDKAIKHSDSQTRMRFSSANDFIESMRKAIKGVNIDEIKDLPVERMEPLYPQGEYKKSSVLLSIYIRTLQMDSMIADLMLALVDSKKDILHTLDHMVSTDTWPESFYGVNILTEMAKHDQIYLRGTTIAIARNPMYILTAWMYTNQIYNIFDTFKWFASYMDEYYQY